MSRHRGGRPLRPGCEPIFCGRVITDQNGKVVTDRALTDLFKKDGRGQLHAQTWKAEDGKQTVCVYQIKQGKEIWVRSPSTGNTVKSHQLKADLVSEMQVEAYAPVEPWQWSRDADCVGAERGVVNG